MQCLKCSRRDSQVIDTRKSKHAIRRRRQCKHCSKRWTTYEMHKERLDLLENIALLAAKAAQIRTIAAQLMRASILLNKISK
jgi:transcriptional regulator NrdR family protein